MTGPATPGQWLDALLALPAKVARIDTRTQELVRMAGESQAALTELSNAVTTEMAQYATRNEQLETQVRGLLDQLGASQAQVDSLDLGIAADIRAAIPRIQAIVPDVDPGTGGPVTAAPDTQQQTAQQDTAQQDTADPTGTTQGESGGAVPVQPQNAPADTPNEYTIPRSDDDGADLGEADRPFTYHTGDPASGNPDRAAAPVDPRGGVNDDYDQADPVDQ